MTRQGSARHGRCAACDRICRCGRSHPGGGVRRRRHHRPSVRVDARTRGRRRGGLTVRRNTGLRLRARRCGALNRDFEVCGRPRTGALRRVDDTRVLDDLSRRVGVLAKRAATAPSRVGVVCHDTSDYQSGTIDDVPERSVDDDGPAAWRGCGSVVGTGAGHSVRAFANLARGRMPSSSRPQATS